MINSAGRALVCTAGRGRFIFRERVERRNGRSRDQLPVPREREERGSRAKFPGSSRRKEQEAAGSISGTY